MASIPGTNTQIVVEKVELDVTSGEANAAGDTFEELYSWTFRSDHPEAVTQYGEGSRASYARGGQMFDFSCWASRDLESRLSAAYNFGSGPGGQLPLRFYHLKYYTDAGGSTPSYANFSGRIKSLSTSGQGGGETRVAVACTVRLQDADYILRTSRPTFAAANTTSDL